MALQGSVHDQQEVGDADDVDLWDAELAAQRGGDGRYRHGTFLVEDDKDQRLQDINNVLQQHGAHAIDFKGESFTFKATTAGILGTLGHCIELMAQREEAWKRRVEREQDKRKRAQESCRLAVEEAQQA